MSEATPAKPHDPASSGFWWLPGGLLAAAAAAIVMWWVWPPNQDVRDFGNEIAGQAGTETGASEGDSASDGGATSDSATTGSATGKPDALPSYVLETDGGLEPAASKAKADDAAPARLRYNRDTSFEWALRPVTNTGPGVELGIRGFAFVDGGSAGLPLALDPLVQILESGAIQITGKIGQLGLEPGRYTIALTIGRPEALPVQAADVFVPSPKRTPVLWVVRRVEVVIEE